MPQNVGCAADLDDHLREKAQHTRQYVSTPDKSIPVQAFLVNDRSKVPAGGVS